MAKLSTDLQIQYLATTTLKPNPRNARTHSKKQVRQIAESIKSFGFTNPIIIDDQHMVLAGHGRLAAAKELGQAVVPCVAIASMTPAQKRAYVLADNKLALNAGWDEDMLADELQAILSDDEGFDVSLTGFSIAEVDSLIADQKIEEAGDPADDLLPKDGPARCKPGDLWQLGPHRLICGNSLDESTIAQLMGGKKARMVFTDPPYNVPIDGHVSEAGKVKHREFAMASGEMSKEQFTAFLRSSFLNLHEFTINGSIHFICMDWRHITEVQAAAEGIYSELKNLLSGLKTMAAWARFIARVMS